LRPKRTSVDRVCSRYPGVVLNNVYVAFDHSFWPVRYGGRNITFVQHRQGKGSVWKIVVYDDYCVGGTISERTLPLL